MQIMPVRNRLAYPAGIAPGFDPKHPAANGSMFSEIMLSGIAPTNIQDPETGSGLPANFTFNGSVGAAMDGALGPVMTIGNFADPRVFGPGGGAIPHKITMAIILRPGGAQTGLAIDGLNTIAVNWFTNASGFIVCQKNGSGTPVNITSTVQIAAHTPYFLALSSDDAVGCNFVALNLATGQLQQNFQADTTAITVTPDGWFVINNSGTAMDGVAAFTCTKTVALSRSQLVQWAEDPWAYWYPQRLMIGDQQLATPAASFVPSYTASAQQVVIGGGTGGVGAN